MKNKPTQFERNLMENARKQLEEFKKSGAFEILKNRSEFAEGMLKNTPKVPKITPIGDLTPSDKRIRKAEALLYEYTFNKKDTNVEDVLKALEIVGKSRVKDDTKPKTGHYTGASFKQAQKFISISKSYEKLKETKTPTRAKNILMKKYNISLSTLTRYITNGNRLRKK